MIEDPLDIEYQKYLEGLEDGRAEAREYKAELLHYQSLIIQYHDILEDWLSYGEALMDVATGKEARFHSEDLRHVILETKLTMGKAIW